MPKIGKRILKSSLAVFLCFVIYLLRNEEGIVFYSCIAGVLCVQQSTSNTIKVARNRVEGTLIGGFVGMLVLLFEKNFIPHDLILIQYVLISIMIIPIIYFTVVLKKTSASYISCVVFMSVTVSHAMDVNPYMFAFDRIVDTLIGIFVALFINGIQLPFHRNKKILFYIDMDALALDSYQKIKLNQMIEHGANISFTCKDTPGTFLPKLKGLEVSLPILCFDGVMHYDMHSQTFSHMHTLAAKTYDALIAYTSNMHTCCFTYTIQYNMTHIYFDNTLDTYGQTYVNKQRLLPYDHYICAHKPCTVEAFAIMFYVENEKAQQLKEELTKQFQEITCVLKEKEQGRCCLFVLPKVNMHTLIQEIADEETLDTTCLFQEKIAHEQIIKTIHKQFYTFH